jgi:hypothetical protein
MDFQERPEWGGPPRRTETRLRRRSIKGVGFWFDGRADVSLPSKPLAIGTTCYFVSNNATFFRDTSHGMVTFTTMALICATVRDKQP